MFSRSTQYSRSQPEFESRKNICAQITAVAHMMEGHAVRVWTCARRIRDNTMGLFETRARGLDAMMSCFLVKGMAWASVLQLARCLLRISR
ncbi:hypothetical protein [Bradyrhizobium nanningense]|uniref:hypothetical protein n=1 Tax=Bradyrhizobium nanningense TaxID=1325118 RepID=UPI0010086CD2|nr:hypothetical protein [Bradyrhizobium nanningense]